MSAYDRIKVLLSDVTTVGCPSDPTYLYQIHWTKSFGLITVKARFKSDQSFIDAYVVPEFSNSLSFANAQQLSLELKEALPLLKRVLASAHPQHAEILKCLRDNADRERHPQSGDARFQ